MSADPTAQLSDVGGDQRRGLRHGVAGVEVLPTGHGMEGPTGPLSERDMFVVAVPVHAVVSVPVVLSLVRRDRAVGRNPLDPQVHVATVHPGLHSNGMLSWVKRRGQLS